MKANPWFMNRVFWGMFLFLLVVALWSFYWKPQYRPFYEEGVKQYSSGDYTRALSSFSQAYSIAPNSSDVILMMGWTSFKLRNWDEARYYFDRAIRLDPRTSEAQIGLAFVYLETGKGTIDPEMMKTLLKQRRGDANLQLLAAAALEQKGSYFEAADLYRGLLDNRAYGATARTALDDIFGLRGSSDTPPSVLPPPTAASTLQVRFRAADGALWQQQGSDWQRLYVNGVDFGPAAPGYLPTSLPNDNGQYSRWLQLASNLRANLIRTYTLLPPAFYRSYKHYLDRGGRTLLLQQVWIADPPGNDLWNSDYMNDVQAEMRYVVDAIHGRGSVPPRRYRSGGVFDQDISAQVAGILFGRELDAAVIGQTNAAHPGKKSYAGKYVSAKTGTPIQVWYAEMLDYLVNYETSTYGWQHPVAAVSGAAPDPQRSPLIEQAFVAEPAFTAGIFSAYPAFPYDPEYVQDEARYQQARDSQGPNPVYGYLRELKARTPFPLVVSEMGIASSLVTRQAVPSGWNLGGHSDEEQAQILQRMTQAVHEAGCAGGIVFELMDEWYRQGWSSEGFAAPADRAPLWVNQVDPAQHYGLVGYRSSRSQLFSFADAPWEAVPSLYAATPASSARDPYDAERRVTAVQAAADESYLYLRLKLACLDCVGSSKDGKTHFDQVAYAVALNTLPARAGIQRLPFGSTLENGANFLLYFGPNNEAKLLVADNYNPLEIVDRSDKPGRKALRFRRNFQTGFAPAGQFVPMPLSTVPSSGVLRWGNPDPQARDYDSRAMWYADARTGVIVARIPWASLLVTDPSQLRVFYSFNDSGIHYVSAPGSELAVFVLDTAGSKDPAGMKVAASLPPPSSGKLANPAQFRWKPWNNVSPELYLKKSYATLQREFGQATEASNQKSPSGARVPVSLDRRGEVR